MRVIYMGTPEIAAVILESIINEDIEIAAVVTQPDKPKGRGKEMAFPEVKKIALKYNLPILQPIKVRDEKFISKIKNMDIDIILVAAFGQILPKALLDIPKYGCICVHASLLPKYRGAAPIQWAVINGEDVTGITIIYMNEGIDTGDMILKKEILLDKKETGGTLHDKLASLGSKALKEALQMIKEGTVKRLPQDNEQSSYARILKKSDGNMDFKASAVSLERLVRGLNPWPSAFTYYKGKMLKIWDVEVCDDYNAEKLDDRINAGTVIASDNDNIYIKTGDGILKICELQLEGKKRMICSEFLRGYLIEKGYCFCENS